MGDTHFGEDIGSDLGPQKDRNSTLTILKLLGMEKPDLVVLMGDQLTADEMPSNASDYVHLMVKPIVAGNYRWASIYGNHDNGINLSREDVFQAEMKYNTCYTQHGPPELPGVTNYYLLIYPPENVENSSPAMIFWFLDSLGGITPDGELPNLIQPIVIDWFREEHSRLQGIYGNIPNFGFLHIPTDEVEELHENIDANPQCSGLADDTVWKQDYNTGMMDVLVDYGIETLFIAHAHGNGWCCYYRGMEICYNRKTGYGGYGEWTRGARVVEFKYSNLEERINYVRLETEEKVDFFPKTSN